MVKILVLHQKDYDRDTFFPSHIRKQLEEIGEVHWNESGRPFTEDALLDVIGDKDVILGGWCAPVFTGKLLEKAARLRYIGQVGGSIKHYLTREVFDKNITISNAAEGTARYVAEGTLALMLASLKDVTGLNAFMKEERMTPSGAIYTDSLFKKKVGLIGLGKVGRHLLKLLKPFGNTIYLYDPYISEKECGELEVQPKELDFILQYSDVISIHAAKTRETINLLNLEKLRMIKHGALLVNTARAAVMDEAALLGELKKGRFKAALDVFWQEPLPLDSEFRKLPNVILTPHQIASCMQGRYELSQMVIDDLKLFLQGETPRNRITRELYEIMA